MKTLISVVSILVLFAVNSGRAAVAFTNEFWICTNATGNMFPAGGTIDNPLDGSSQVNFDSNMNSIPAHSAIHILAGKYVTKGLWGGYSIKSGQKIHGSGIDVTVLQHPSGFYVGYSGAVMMGSVSPSTNIEVCDLTLDCNAANNSDTYSGIELDGTDNAVRRVKLINCAHFGGNSESWGISLQNNSRNNAPAWNIIEDCEVSHYRGGDANLTALTLTGANNSGVIRNNRVLGDIDSNIFATAPANRDTRIEGNYIENVLFGCRAEGSFTNLLLINNTFNNVANIVDFGGGIDKNIGILFNNITMATNDYQLPNYNRVVFVIDFQPTFYQGPPSIFTNVFVFGNIVTLDGIKDVASDVILDFVRAYNTTGITIKNNFLDSRLTNDFPNSSNINVSDNYDLNGNYLDNVNMLTLGGVSVSLDGLDLISQGSVSEMLTNLGLPAIPSVIVTNGSKVPVLTVTNLVVGYLSGDGAGLTNVQTSALVGNLSFLGYLYGGSGIAFRDGNPGFSAYTNWYLTSYTGYGPPYAAGLVRGQTWTSIRDMTDSVNGDWGYRFDNASGVPTMFVDSSAGTVGINIGTNNPKHALEVHGDLSFYSGLYGGGIISLTDGNPAFAGNTNWYITSYGGIGTPYTPAFVRGQTWTSIRDATDPVNGDWGYRFDNAGGTPIMFVDSSAGTVGINIGTNNPGYTLDVNGTANVINSFRVGGTLSVTNGLVSTLSNSLAAVSISIGSSPYFWTNTSLVNVVVYINDLTGAVGYNGGLLFGPVTNVPITVMLQPTSYLSITNTGGSPVLKWHPF